MLKAGLTRIPFVRVRYMDTWQGRSICPAEALEKWEALGLEVKELEGPGTTMMWVGGRKK